VKVLPKLRAEMQTLLDRLVSGDADDNDGNSE
jgi:hypothetical protein